jgi:hypothetical protein
VAKLVDDLGGSGLASGTRVAEFLAARVLACGAPARTCGGELTIGLPEGRLALLRHEPGTPPDLSNPGQVRRAGRLLAQAHQALRDFPAGANPRYRWPWEWVGECLDTIAMPGHINAAARRIWPQIVRTVTVHRLAVSVIHADPGPDGFLFSGDGNDAQDALIDWATPLRGPHAAHWFTEGYAAQMPEIGPQLGYLDSLIKARWLANAIYFSARIERGITRGSDSPAANHDGLAAAYAGMTASG